MWSPRIRGWLVSSLCTVKSYVQTLICDPLFKTCWWLSVLVWTGVNANEVYVQHICLLLMYLTVRGPNDKSFRQIYWRTRRLEQHNNYRWHGVHSLGSKRICNPNPLLSAIKYPVKNGREFETHTWVLLCTCLLLELKQRMLDICLIRKLTYRYIAPFYCPQNVILRSHNNSARHTAPNCTKNPITPNNKL